MAQNDENSTSENEIETISATPESAVDVKEVDESFKPITVNVDENSCILEMKYFEIESTRIWKPQDSIDRHVFCFPFDETKSHTVTS